jgi:ADP-ribose pyrophosphatase YjhB (NUDIX family)
MTHTLWKPNVVVAAVIEDAGRFLLVEEQTEDGLRYNQPAGHLEKCESLLDAVRREVSEETARHFEPTGLLGIYKWPHPTKDLTYLRFAFTGVVTGFDPVAPLDIGIVRAVWLTREEIAACQARHRSPFVLRCVDDYLTGRRFPLDLLTEY